MNSQDVTQVHSPAKLKGSFLLPCYVWNTVWICNLGSTLALQSNLHFRKNLCFFVSPSNDHIIYFANALPFFFTFHSQPSRDLMVFSRVSLNVNSSLKVLPKPTGFAPQTGRLSPPFISLLHLIPVIKIIQDIEHILLQGGYLHACLPSQPGRTVLEEVFYLPMCLF